MVSDFIDEKNGYLALTQEEYDKAKTNNPRIWMHARVLLEYGETKEGYWTSDKGHGASGEGSRDCRNQIPTHRWMETRVDI